MAVPSSDFLADGNRDDRKPGRVKGGGRTAHRHPTLEAAFDAANITDAASLSFHHHYRDGDATLNAVLRIAADKGLRGLRLFVSSLFPIHAPVAEYVRTGVVGGLHTDYAIGPVADAIVNGWFSQTVVFESHGRRAAAISDGSHGIDVAFVAASRADGTGAATGAGGRAPCGPLGYPMVDVERAGRIVIVADMVQESSLEEPEIGGQWVDHFVEYPGAGNPSGISSGATRLTGDPVANRIADLAAEVVFAAGAMVDGFSCQTGAGGSSLATMNAIGQRMRSAGVRGSFLSGGITGTHVSLCEAGLFEEILDVQSFDVEAARSYERHAWHRAMSAAEYASPEHPNPVVDRLDVVVLGATEIDRHFNVNVILSGEGNIIGGPGGHPDTAEGARLTVVTTRLNGGGFAKIVDRVACCVTPGNHVDVLVTERGIAVNPARADLTEKLRDHGLPIVDIDELVAVAAANATRQRVLKDGPIVAEVHGRRGGLVGVVRR